MGTPSKKSSKKPISKITAEMLKELQDELRELDLGWVEKLEEQIRKDKSVDQKYIGALSARKIYNVFNNIVRNNGWKVLMYSQGKTLRGKLESQMQKVAQ